MKKLTACLIAAAVITAAVALMVFAEPDRSPRDVYMEYCATCHGGQLQGGMAQSLVDGVWQFGNERGYIFRNIKFGIPNLGMPGYEKTLSDRQINDLVRFLLDAESAAAPPKPTIPKEVQTLDYTIKVDIVAEGLQVPWSIAFLDKDHALVTERAGRLRQIIDGRLLPDPIRGTPEVLNEGQGGLLDVAVDPDYADNGWIYLAYSHVLDGQGGRPGAMTRLVRGKLTDNTWTAQQVIYEAPHETYSGTRHHYGCRIVFDRKGHLFFGVGDRGVMQQAQQLDRPNGKIHRILPDGTIPEDNPFAAQPDALDTLFAYGIRNPQGLAIHPQTDALWETEHGPLGGDEVNLIEAGKNYGWPVISYGRDYDGSIITVQEKKEGLEQPVYYWTPSIAVCSMDFVTGPLFEKWRHHLLVSALKYEEVRLLDVYDRRVLHDEVILKNAGRVRDVVCAPDGSIYVVLNSPGTIIRLTPAP